MKTKVRTEPHTRPRKRDKRAHTGTQDTAEDTGSLTHIWPIHASPSSPLASARLALRRPCATCDASVRLADLLLALWLSAPPLKPSASRTWATTAQRCKAMQAQDMPQSSSHAPRSVASRDSRPKAPPSACRLDAALLTASLLLPDISPPVFGWARARWPQLGGALRREERVLGGSRRVRFLPALSPAVGVCWKEQHKPSVRPTPSSRPARVAQPRR